MSEQFILYNGWISISTSPNEESYDGLQEVISQLNEFIKSLNLGYQLCEIRIFNLEHVLLLGGSHNHDVGYSDSIIKLLYKIAELAPGSYGIVYIRWPEDPVTWNEFKVYKMAKGKISIENDPFFSPCRPMIEE